MHMSKNSWKKVGERSAVLIDVTQCVQSLGLDNYNKGFENGPGHCSEPGLKFIKLFYAQLS